jgi:hypothetical protein
MKRTPLALFTYNRPAHTQAMLEAVAACHRLPECRVFIFSDGPKTNEQAKAVHATRAILQEWRDRLGAKIIEQTVNLGLARSIVDGVTKLCSEFGRVIVLEDDLVPARTFIHFMLSALDRYENDSQVAQISGYMFPVQHAAAPDAFFLPYISSWGWATWERAWRLFEANPDISALRDPELVFQFNHNGVTNHAKMLRNRMAGLNQSWAVLFYWAVFIHNKLTLYPRVSLVKNTGFDGTGVHHNQKLTSRQKLFLNYEKWLFKRTSWKLTWDGNTEFVWPEKVIVDHAAYSRITSYRKLYAGDFVRFVMNTL